MRKSMSLLKREHEKTFKELSDVLNKLKTELIQKDISAYLKETNFQGENSSLYGVEISEKIYAKASTATGGGIYLSLEDRRKTTYEWMFEIEFKTKFYQVPHIFTSKSENKFDSLLYVEDIDSGSDDEALKVLVQDAVDKLSTSVNIVKQFDKETVKYSYLKYDDPKTGEIKKFDRVSNIVKYVKQFSWQ